MQPETHETALQLGWKVGIDYPEWGNNDFYLTTIKSGYLLPNETPKQAYHRLSKTASDYLNRPDLRPRFYDIFWKGWLVPSTPVFSNFGTDRGLPISCYGSVIHDSIYELGRKNLEMMVLSQKGGGTSYDFSQIRALGTPIKGGIGGKTDGIVPFIKGYDSFIHASKQANLRRGAVAIYLDANHGEIDEFIKLRSKTHIPERQCLNIHHAVKLDDAFMHRVESGDKRALEVWGKVIRARVEDGEPYLFFTDNANRDLPDYWKNNNLTVKHSNLCSEIQLPDDDEHTFVCCLSSLNLARYNEWAGTDVVYLATYFLDAVMEEFIRKAKSIPGIEDAVRFAEKSRALGLGVQGWHTYLQQERVPFVSITANTLTRQIFEYIQGETIRATNDLATEYGEPLWCKNSGRRNLTLTAVAPTRSSSKLSGDTSEGVEPIAANIYIDNDAKGVHIRKNPQLVSFLAERGLNTSTVWNQIIADKGSVLNVSELSEDEKDVFLTWQEINQLELVKQAAIRQRYIEQGQSINLAFPQNIEAKWVKRVHYEAWKLGLKSLYYYRSESIIRADAKRQRDVSEECLICHG